MASMFIKSKKQPPPQPRGPVPNKHQKTLSPNLTPPNGNSPSPARARSKPRVEESDSQVGVDEPGTYTDYKIFSCDLKSAKFNGFKFDIRRPVKLADMAKPLKLNRKDPLRREDDTSEGVNVPLTPMLGLDGKPVIGADGQMVMVGPDGRPAAQHARPKPTPTPDSKDAKGKRKPFQKKTKQIFTIPEDIRQRRREERFPWMLEDASGKEVWVGQLDDVTKSETHGFLMTMDGDGQGNAHFLFAPSHRWYKMARRPNYRTLGLEEAEEELAKLSKSKNPQYWLMHNKGKEGVSAATAATLVKAESSSMALNNNNLSLGPGGRRLKAVDSGQRSKFELDDEFGDDYHSKRQNEERAGEGADDEMEFEDDFADDDEAGGGMDAIDEDEARELEERIKREYRSQNKGGEDSEDEEADDSQKLTGAGKLMRKLVKKLDKAAAGEDSDKEENPYASEEEESEEEELMPDAPKEPVPTPTPTTPAANGAPSTPNPPPPSSSRPSPKPSTPSQHRSSPPPSGSRAASPGLGLGNSVVAKRATSPKPPRVPPGVIRSAGSRAVSPLAEGSRSRAASPSAPGSRANSPPLASNGKRKSTEDVNGPSGSKLKKAKTSSSLGGAAKSPGPLTEQMIIEWLRNTPNATTKDCITQFKHYLKGEQNKTQFSDMIKKFARVKDGFLVLRSRHGAESPTAAASP